MMNRILTTLTAGALALTIGGLAVAADQTQPNPQSSQAPGTTMPKPGGADLQKQKDEYFAALKKCDAIQNLPEQQRCVDAVRKQYGQM